MKKIPLTLYVTIWYAVFLLAVVGLMYGLISYNTNENSNTIARSRIQEQITDLSDSIGMCEGDFRFDEDINYNPRTVYLSVYDSEGKLLEGVRPIQLGNFPKLQDRNLMREADDAGTYWYIYDNVFDFDGEEIWIRGISQDQTVMQTGRDVTSNIRRILVVLVLVALIGGYLISKAVLSPVRKLTRTADSIREDGDLTRRIEHREGNDEISRLARSFNSMFDRLEQMIKNEKQFTSDVSHELRTPLAVIISSSEYAMTDDEYKDKALETINREATRMSGLVSRLLTLSRSDSGRLTLNYEDVDLTELCRNVVEQQQMLVEDTNIEIVSDIKENVHAECDEGFVIRMLLNLVSNAIAYGVTRDADGNVVSGHIEISLKVKHGHAVISVKDKGPGISKEIKSRIWDRFYRADESRSESGSSGLGLSMVKTIAQNHGGDATVTSEEGKGCTFTVRIPLTKGGKRNAKS